MTVHNMKNDMPLESGVIILEHTNGSHLTDIIEVLKEELDHWNEQLIDDPISDKAGRRSAALFYLLCDLEVDGYEAP